MRFKLILAQAFAVIAVMISVLAVVVAMAKLIGTDLALAISTAVLTILFVRWATLPTEWFPDGFAHDLAKDGTNVIGLVVLAIVLFTGGIFAIVNGLLVFGIVLCFIGAGAVGQFLASLEMPVSGHM